VATKAAQRTAALVPDGLILTESQLAALEKAKVDEAAHASSTARHEDDGKCYDERELDPRQQNDACIINPASP
jgi:hypothetical protein